MSKLTVQYKKEIALRSTREPLLGSGSANNIFGTIARNVIPIATTMGFIPEDANSNIIELANDGGIGAQWLNLASKNMQYWAYVYCSPLAAVIDRLAEADTNGEICLWDNDNEVIKDKKSWIKNPRYNRIMSLMKNPNPIQTWEEFNSEQIVYCKIFGYCPVLAVSPSGMDKSFTKYLFNVNPYFANPNTSIGEYDIYAPEEPIKSWSLSINGRIYGDIPASDIILVRDGFISTVTGNQLPMSKIAGLDYFVSNICAAMEADNVLLKKKGPLGVFSHDPKPDIGGWMPLQKEEKDELQSDLRRYGLTIGQLQYVVSKTPLKWNAMSFNVQELMTKETVRQGTDGICDRFGYPAELMSGKNATYENRTSAEKFLYQNNIIPFNLRRMARYDKFFGLDDVSLYMDYDHLPVLQEDIMKSGQASYAESQALDIDWKNGIITYNEYRKKKNLDAVGDGNVYYPEWAKKNGIDLNPKPVIKNGTPPKNTSTKK